MDQRMLWMPSTEHQCPSFLSMKLASLCVVLHMFSKAVLVLEEWRQRPYVIMLQFLLGCGVKHGLDKTEGRELPQRQSIFWHTF